MTPKDKAMELVDRFLAVKQINPNAITRPYNWQEAKQCALICVDVILNDVGAKDWELDTGTNTNYWIEVKQEIEKL
jgi:hypothetical protein